MADFDQVFSDHYDFICKYLTKLSKDPLLAEELTQETFFRAYMNYNRLKDPEKISVWLCQIAKNCFFTWCKANRNSVALGEDLEDGGPDLADALIQKDLSRNAFARLHELEEPYKEVFMLSVFANLSLSEISALFEKSESWARVTFYRAKKKLLGKLRENHEL